MLLLDRHVLEISIFDGKPAGSKFLLLSRSYKRWRFEYENLEMNWEGDNSYGDKSLILFSHTQRVLGYFLLL